MAARLAGRPAGPAPGGARGAGRGCAVGVAIGTGPAFTKAVAAGFPADATYRRTNGRAARRS
ncbi:hypothetical protein GCM10010393_36060 [Streptomyces gobitricini]|uniref:Uncharacterized protein n=1 Tax=Streptomyces gobitricini TaxID=68211 RepID=A0ABP5ZPE3_9ACTN